MLIAFQEHIKKTKLFLPENKILLAVSGGIDSVVMANLFYRSNYDFSVVHCNFGLRGIESDGDELFVKDLAAKYNKVFYSEKFETQSYANDNGVSIQMAARELRYNFFRQLAEHYSINFIATAHHKDDEAETFFINLLRGTGISGLTGINANNQGIIRPLLFASKENITEYAISARLKYREDSSNKEDKYLRNKIRHIIIPALKQIDPVFDETLHSNMQKLYQAETIYKTAIEKKAAEIITETQNNISINISQLLATEAPETYLYEFICKYGFNYSMINNIISICTSSIPGKIFKSSSHILLVDRDNIIIRKLEKDGQQKSVFHINNTDKEIFEPIHLTICRTRIDNNFKIPVESNNAFLDASKIKFPLVIRHWEKGDYFYPLGNNGRKKLSDFFNNLKINRFEKEKIWLICSEGNIIWIAGYRISNKFRITNETKEAYIIKLI